MKIKGVRRKRGKRKYNYFKIFSVILIIIFIALLPTTINKLVKIKSINCSSQYGECPEEIINNLQFTINNDLNAAKKQIEQELQDSFLVDSFLIQYKIPSTLDLELIIKKPKYALKDKNSDRFYLLDKDGVVLEQHIQTNLPFIEAENLKLDLGTNVSNKLLFSSKILHSLNWQYQVSGGEIRDEGLFIKLPNGPFVIFPTDGDDLALIGALRLIYSRLNQSDKGIRIENVREIDLRFKNPVVR